MKRVTAEKVRDEYLQLMPRLIAMVSDTIEGRTVEPPIEPSLLFQLLKLGMPQVKIIDDKSKPRKSQLGFSIADRMKGLQESYDRGELPTSSYESQMHTLHRLADVGEMQEIRQLMEEFELKNGKL